MTNQQYRESSLSIYPFESRIRSIIYFKVPIFLVLALISCKSQTRTSPNEDLFKSFNSRAGLYFMNSSQDLNPLKKNEQCIVNQTIENDLDDLNNWKLTQIDSLHIRNYHIEGLEFDFSFVADSRSRFYFIAMPTLYNILTDSRFYGGAAEGYFRRDSTEIVMKLNNNEIDDLFNTKVFNDTVDVDQQHRRAKRLIKELHLFYTDSEIMPAVLLDNLQDDAKWRKEYNDSELAKLINQPLYERPSGSYINVFELPGCGHILLIFSKDKNSNRLKMEILFIAGQKRALTFRDIDYVVKFRDCRKK